ncbi:DUF5676 family membrane protein [Sphingobium lactosutens]|jgi:hypothetical protein|uniref:Uncharacterized protein n=1 Tax=Sphingobium lactosutens DS20 TaxID=1331060 RepID=T0IPZ7_9SPHN|nr:DUF5676 family membrane protein [Sphingobium lactosutens]EQB11724.1 hypothetical protein RLDS_21575 [Sphingobium lactosutens DS20]
MAEPAMTVQSRTGNSVQAITAVRQIPLVTFGTSFGIFLAITYVLCVGHDLLFPAQAMHPSWERLLPGFIWLDWPSFILGLIESFAYAWYVALIFCPLFNFLAARTKRGRQA